MELVDTRPSTDDNDDDDSEPIPSGPTILTNLRDAGRSRIMGIDVTIYHHFTLRL